MVRLAILLFSLSLSAFADMWQITTQNESDIASSSIPVIVDVNATWCHPCQMMGPIFDEVAQEFEGKAQFAKIDFDSQPDLVHKYGVTSLPTLLFFKAGKKSPSMKSVGLLTKEELEDKVEKFIKK